MAHSRTPTSDWSAAVSDAEKHIDERAEALSVAAERQKPRDRRALVWSTGLLLLVAVAANVWQLTRPAISIDPIFERQNLVWAVVDAAQLVEDFRIEHGRLPASEEIGDDLGPDASYATEGATYRVSVRGVSAELAYESTVPLEDWIARRRDVAAALGAAP